MVLKTNKNIEFLIDDEDYPKVKAFTWYLSKIGYIVCDIQVNKVKKQIRLHRLLMNVEQKNILIDHINRNRLDNRKSNLRIANKQQNAANSKISIRNTSGFKGVTFKKDKGKWKAYIAVNNKQIHLGYYDTANEAAKKYNQSASEYFGEFANQNILEAI